MICVRQKYLSSIISHFFEIRRRYLNTSLTLYLFWRVSFWWGFEIMSIVINIFYSIKGSLFWIFHVITIFWQLWILKKTFFWKTFLKNSVCTHFQNESFFSRSRKVFQKKCFFSRLKFMVYIFTLGIIFIRPLMVWKKSFICTLYFFNKNDDFWSFFFDDFKKEYKKNKKE